MQAERARDRRWSAAAIAAVIALGLASRRFPGLVFSGWLGKYPGDSLWALMVFCGWGMIFPKYSTRRVLVLTLVTSGLVEFLKLYQAPWMNDFRRTTICRLVFGTTFSWVNFVAYTVGAAVGAAVEYCFGVGRGKEAVLQ